MWSPLKFEILEKPPRVSMTQAPLPGASCVEPLSHTHTHKHTHTHTEPGRGTFLEARVLVHTWPRGAHRGARSNVLCPRIVSGPASKHQKTYGLYGPLRACYGQAMGKLWASYGQAMGKLWAASPCVPPRHHPPYPPTANHRRDPAHSPPIACP